MTEAELLFTQILDCNRLSLYLNEGMYLERGSSHAVSSVLKRRISGEPIQYILGRTEFMGLEFKVNPSVLIPRQETELLVEGVIKVVAGFSLRSDKIGAATTKILDLGTGSGCIAVSLAKFLQGVRITAVDISHTALKTARENAVLNNVAERIEFFEGDLFDYGQGQALPLRDYDLIVTNPPYIPSREIANLQTEIKYEPLTALDAGEDGLDFYRRIIKQAPAYLKENGFLIMEMGFNQCDAIKNILRESGKFAIIEIVKDYSGIERVIVGKSVKRKAKSAKLKCKTFPMQYRDPDRIGKNVFPDAVGILH